LAALRNFAITALRLAGTTVITAAMCDHARNPAKPLGATQSSGRDKVEKRNGYFDR
jgi:hypothetical protein